MKTEQRSFDQQEFAQFVIDRLDRVDGRVKGLHFILNAICDDIRKVDPDQAIRLSDFIEARAREEDVGLSTNEVVAAYVGVLRHGTVPPKEVQ